MFWYLGLKEEGVDSVKDAWKYVEVEDNSSWQFGIKGGYIVMNVYHHAGEDGTSGMFIREDRQGEKKINAFNSNGLLTSSQI